MKKIIFLLLSFSLISCNREEITIDASSKANILRIIEAEKGIQKMNAISFAVVKDDEILWADALGEATRTTTATVETRFFIASISKAVAAIAAMQLVESNALDLDVDINNYLPFRVTNPKHPNIPMTIRMLLNHSTSISDAIYYTIDWACWNEDCPITLAQFLSDLLATNGQFYANRTFFDYAPGEKSNYSNIGYALLGYIVERVSNQPFDEYCQQNIFTPLGMSKTTFRLKNVPLSELAIPFSPTFTPSKPYYTLPDYPGGGVITTPTDFSKFLRMLINKGTFEGTQIISSQTLSLMQQRTLSMVRGGLAFDFGLGMYYYNFNGTVLYGHGGGDQGITSTMAYDIEKRVGVIFVTNTTLINPDLIVYSLYKFGAAQ
ncbi:MAG TPA: serine hydrolase [Saprospiraceae bacterium]|nr:serine hydrolase [Saprospiraceae bacterium]HMP24240.1 serine hydrolase [Saprospiraceae bacterium]